MQHNLEKKKKELTGRVVPLRERLMKTAAAIDSK